MPIRAWHEHTREVFSVDWSNIEKATFVSASWDGSVKLVRRCPPLRLHLGLTVNDSQWTPDRPHSILTLAAHQGCVYQALFSPHTPSVIGTCSLDGTVKIFDLRRPQQPSGGQPPLATPALTTPSSGAEVLSIDWNKYRPWLLASAGVDRSIRVWDLRMVKPVEGEALTMGAVAGTCENELRGHEYAVRKVQWSPHRADLIASASYDMSCRV